VRRALARRLASEGFVVCEASSAADVRDSDPSLLACAVIDLELPDGDGPDLAATLRNARGSLPLAFFTASTAAQLRERARAYGPVFDKPNLDAVVAWAKKVAQPPPTK
jgi:CheY-like chemotaxis protein